MEKPRVLILGPPGAGKGTQSQNIADEYEVEHITTGGALRANKDMDISHLDAEYDTPRAYMEAGDLVPDAVVTEIVSTALESAAGFVLDGYPRNHAQADALAEMTDLDVVLELSVPREELLRRLTGRRIDPETGESYHTEFDLPADEAAQDRLVQRDDDTREAVSHRLDVFDENTAPVVDRYRDHEGFAEIDGGRPPEAVWTTITDTIRPVLE